MDESSDISDRRIGTNINNIIYNTVMNGERHTYDEIVVYDDDDVISTLSNESETRQNLNIENHIGENMNTEYDNGDIFIPNMSNMVHERIRKAGWYLPDGILKHRMFNRGKYMPCFVCENMITYPNVGASKTIPRHLMKNNNPHTGMEPINQMENVNL